MQSAIHEGYEYQDYFSVSIILQLMLQRKDAEIIVDRKDFNGDKFDDLKVKLSNGITEFQIKYSDEESSHNLTKSDLSNGNGHDTALCDLFASWKTRKESENNTEIKLCLAWGRPADDDPIAKFLKPIQEHTMPFSTVAYSFDGAAFWPAEDTPPKTWKKFNLKIKSEPIEREDFLAFCNELTFILEMPKASLDLKKPGDIENVIIQQVEKLGVGIYPNDNLRVEDVIGKLAMEVKHSRAIGNKLYTNVLMGRLGLIADYGKFDQRFPVDSAHQIILSDEIERLHQVIRDSKHVIISGNPGSGKSWLVDEYIDKIKKENSKVIHYNCFQSLQDINSLERIRVDSLYGNLVSQIVEQCPKLIEHKKTILGADKAELENLLCLIGEEIYLVVDGLDHISREYELHKDLISRSETEIISELLEIQFPDNCYVLISSQPIKALENFRTRNYGVFEIPQKVEIIINILEKAGYEAYAVGGCVRDALLGRTPNDWDITTSAKPEQVKALFHRTVDTGIAHGTVTVLLEKEGFEVTTYRVDGEYEDGRHPKEVTFTACLEEDLKRRDFTINAMAYNPRKGLVDLFEGQKDLENKVIRCVGDPLERFTEDALRIMRAVRFSAQLGFSLEEETRKALSVLAPNLKHVSAERIQVELVKLLVSPHPDYLRIAYEAGVTREFLPEFDRCMETPQNTPHHCYNVGEHILHSLLYVREDKVLRLTMLLHDIAKPVVRKTDENGRDHFKTHASVGEKMSKEILRRLKFDNDTISRVSRLIRWHDLRPTPAPAEVRKAINVVGEDLFPMWMEVQYADNKAKSDYRGEEKAARQAGVRMTWEEIMEKGECVSMKGLAITGSDLIAAGMKPGKEMGSVLHELLDAVLENPELNKKEALLSLAFAADKKLL